MSPGRRALLLSYFTVFYNILEGLISIAFGSVAGSIALIGFGLDSFVESFSGGVMIWRFRKHGSMTKDEEERTERRSIMLVGIAFFVLAAYIFVESARKLYLREMPHPSLPGAIIAIISLVVMSFLFFEKNRIGKDIKSHSLVCDSKQTLACMAMSVALLLGIGANYLFGFWQADPIAGLIIGGLLVKEGYAAVRHQDLC